MRGVGLSHAIGKVLRIRGQARVTQSAVGVGCGLDYFGFMI